MEEQLAKMEQEVERDLQIQRTMDRKRSNAEAFQDEMDYKRNATDEYLVNEGKEPSEEEPTNLTLTEE